MKTITGENTQKKRNVSIDYFRAFLMILVVLHHATLAYSTTGAGVLITDQVSFVGFDLIALYNDSFFMFAFFFISGLFSYKALVHKGAGEYLGDRFIRLMLPFAFGALFINPVAHYFSYLYSNGISFSLKGYISYLFENFGQTAVNHLWFLWVLFFFSIILALYDKLFQSKTTKEYDFINQYVKQLSVFIFAMLIFSFILYLPTRNLADGGFVTLIKPFNMQVSRILLYFLYFAAGNIIGTKGLHNSFFSQQAFLKKWWLFIGISVLLNFLNLIIHIIRETMTPGFMQQMVRVVEEEMLIGISLFAMLGFMGLFSKKVKEENKVMDFLAQEAMGIYVIHYAVVTALQYLFTFIAIAAVVKGILVTFLTLAISLAFVMLFKKIPVLNIVFGARYNKKMNQVLFIVTAILLLILVFR